MPLKIADREAHFWTKVAPPDSNGCWLWTACENGNGYGVAWTGERIIVAHRYSWELVNGSIPQGLCVLHHCDVRRCVNPEHLFLGTRADNARDMAEKGRSTWGDKHHNAKLSSGEIPEIRRRLEAGDNHDSIARDFGVARTTISNIATGHRWSRVGGAL